MSVYGCSVGGGGVLCCCSRFVVGDNIGEVMW